MNIAAVTFAKSFMKSFTRRIARLRRDRRGSTAVEFALILFPLMVILTAIIETGYVFLIAVIIEGAAGEAARQIRTGNIQGAASPLTAFGDILCDNVFGMVDCNELTIDVRNYTKFADAAPPPMPGAGEAQTFLPGGPGDVVLVRVAYPWTFATPFLEDIIAGAAGGERSFVSSHAFRNEPYLGAIN